MSSNTRQTAQDVDVDSVISKLSKLDFNEETQFREALSRLEPPITNPSKGLMKTGPEWLKMMKKNPYKQTHPFLNVYNVPP